MEGREPLRFPGDREHVCGSKCRDRTSDRVPVANLRLPLVSRSERAGPQSATQGRPCQRAAVFRYRYGCAGDRPGTGPNQSSAPGLQPDCSLQLIKQTKRKADQIRPAHLGNKVVYALDWAAK